MLPDWLGACSIRQCLSGLSDITCSGVLREHARSNQITWCSLSCAQRPVQQVSSSVEQTDLSESFKHFQIQIAKFTETILIPSKVSCFVHEGIGAHARSNLFGFKTVKLRATNVQKSVVGTRNFLKFLGPMTNSRHLIISTIFSWVNSRATKSFWRTWIWRTEIVY